MRFRFTDKERIKSKKQTERLFREGQSFFVYPFKVVYLIENGDEKYTRVLITVSKKKFRKAVERNRIKRQLREAFRKNKSLVNEHLRKSNKQMLLGLIYSAETILPYKETERKLILILQRLIEQDEKAFK